MMAAVAVAWLTLSRVFPTSWRSHDVSGGSLARIIHHRGYSIGHREWGHRRMGRIRCSLDDSEDGEAAWRFFASQAPQGASKPTRFDGDTNGETEARSVPIAEEGKDENRDADERSEADIDGKEAHDVNVTMKFEAASREFEDAFVEMGNASGPGEGVGISRDAVFERVTKILNDLEELPEESSSDVSDAGDWWEMVHKTGRYDTVEFVGDYSDMRTTLHMVLGLDFNDPDKKMLKVLDVGCGASKVSEDLFLDGFRDIIGIDISKSIIDRMKAKYADKKYLSNKFMINLPKPFLDEDDIADDNPLSNEEEIVFEDDDDRQNLPPELREVPDNVFYSADGVEGAAKFPPVGIESNLKGRWRHGKTLEGFSGKFDVVDARELSKVYGSDSFDLIIDKGTLESIAVGNDYRSVHRMLSGISRLLKPGGMFLSVSFALPRERTGLLSGPLPQLRGIYNWSVYPQEMIASNEIQFTMYVCKKKKKKS
ncbi:hypothetical protein AAMO2058_001535500 [Amorphochlora amoebiformis]